MKPARLILALGAMLAMGVFALWGMAALWSHRVGQRLAPVIAQSGASDPVRALQLGAQQDLERADRGLREGNRAELVRALDGARRLARVGQSAAESVFQRPLDAIERARHAIQNDDLVGTARHLHAARAELAAALPTGRSAPPVPPARGALERYRGAVVLDAVGNRIGRVEAFRDGEATLVLGGHQDVFGFINVGGAEVKVPVDDLVCGRAQRLGPTMVVLAGIDPGLKRADGRDGG